MARDAAVRLRDQDGADVRAVGAGAPGRLAAVTVGPGFGRHTGAADLLGNQGLNGADARPDGAHGPQCVVSRHDACALHVGATHQDERRKEGAGCATGVGDDTGAYVVVGPIVARVVAVGALADVGQRRPDHGTQVEGPPAAVRQRHRLQVAQAAVGVGIGAGAVTGRGQTPARVAQGDHAPVAGFDALQVRRRRSVVGVAHPVAVAVGNLRGHQVDVCPGLAAVLVLDGGLRAGRHPVEAVSNAIGRHRDEPFAAAVLDACQAAQLPVLVRHQRVAAAIGGCGGVGAGPVEHFLRALAGNAQLHTLPIVPSRDARGRADGRLGEARAAGGITPSGDPSRRLQETTPDAWRVQVPVAQLPANIRISPCRVAPPQGHIKLAVARQLQIGVLELERAIEQAGLVAEHVGAVGGNGIRRHGRQAFQVADVHHRLRHCGRRPQARRQKGNCHPTGPSPERANDLAHSNLPRSQTFAASLSEVRRWVGRM